MRRLFLRVIIVLLALRGNVVYASDIQIQSADSNSFWDRSYAGLNVGYGVSTTTNTTIIPTNAKDSYVSAWNAGRDLICNTTGVTCSNILNPIYGITALANLGNININRDGFVGGGQIGINHLFRSVFVAGVEADFQGTAMSGHGSYFGAVNNMATARIVSGIVTSDLASSRTALGFGNISVATDWLGTARGRLGVLINPRLLVFGTAGMAYGGVRADVKNNYFENQVGNLKISGAGLVFSNTLGPYQPPAFPGLGSYDDVRMGWTAGSGAEWMITAKLSLKAEALYYDLGSTVINASPVGVVDDQITSNITTAKLRFNGIVARAGLNYHFDTFTQQDANKF